MKAEEIKIVAVIGTAIMGQGMAQGSAQAGLSVPVFAQHKEVLCVNGSPCAQVEVRCPVRQSVDGKGLAG